MSGGGRTYVCERCGGTFEPEPDWTEDKVRAEHDAAFPEASAATPAQLAVVCEDCYVAFNKWFNGLPRRERERMKAEARREAGHSGNARRSK